jgi:hypothetical protein
VDKTITWGRTGGLGTFCLVFSCCFYYFVLIIFWFIYCFLSVQLLF